MQDLGFSIAGLVVGIAVGATGVGGGSLMTPILILICGINPAIAVGTDLLYAATSKSFGVLLHGRHGSLDWKIVGLLALGSLPATILTLVFLSHYETGAQLDHLIKMTLAIAIMTTATLALFQDKVVRFAKRDNLHFLRNLHSRGQLPLTVLCGALIGTLVTISSVGAGVIGMMLLLLLYPRHDPLKLVGSDLAHAVLITAIAGIGHASLGTVDYHMLGFLLLGALPGIWAGTRIGFGLSPKLLKRVIAALLVFVGSGMLVKVMAAGI
ncbi:MAG: sulfite exporter TauE/SafE family protein [Stenotrophobium sp.]